MFGVLARNGHDPHDAGAIFLQNVGICPNCTAIQPRAVRRRMFGPEKASVPMHEAFSLVASPLWICTISLSTCACVHTERSCVLAVFAKDAYGGCLDRNMSRDKCVHTQALIRVGTGTHIAMRRGCTSPTYQVTLRKDVSHMKTLRGIVC
jgi:hypothetical protein